LADEEALSKKLEEESAASQKLEEETAKAEADKKAAEEAAE